MEVGDVGSESTLTAAVGGGVAGGGCGSGLAAAAQTTGKSVRSNPLTSGMTLRKIGHPSRRDGPILLCRPISPTDS